MKILVKSHESELYTIAGMPRYWWEINKDCTNARGEACSLWRGNRWEGMALGKLDGLGGYGGKPDRRREKYSLKWGRGENGKKWMG